MLLLAVAVVLFRERVAVSLPSEVTLENGSDLHVIECQKIHYRARSTEEIRRRQKKNAKSLFYFPWCICKLHYYSDIIHSFDWKSAVEHDGGT